MQNIILNHEQVQQKIERIAYQILEDNINEKVITLVGIANTGYNFAEAISKVLKNISEAKIELIKLKIDKKNSIECLNNPQSLTVNKESVVILIDDVLNSGETLMNSSFIILKHEIKKLRTAVLIDRRHRLFPIKADFAGLTLSTTLDEHIEVEFSDNKFTATLN
jgi:pyrimidine operon attenuation protein/uracil phosphoribosyltransferase